ncbi:MAG: GTPase ObgE [Bacteroidetes bacterium]|nr:GTPase ObgE [Bacteroidota bacterium]
MKFIDQATIFVAAGKGGDGHLSFRREKYVPKGGPDGGNGGKGGDVIFLVDPHLTTLLDFHYVNKYTAKNGQPGGKNQMYGKDGENLIIKVPQGTVVYNADTNEQLADLSEPNQSYTVAKGGNGGFGNAMFATATNQTPRFSNPGLPGESFNITLELKLLADVGIVGFPNVGKSTLISVISAAKPKIADYAFTTLVPNLGIVKIADTENYTVADIPGLIEGASEGRGLGLQFLRHIERTTILLFMIDSFSYDPVSDYNILKEELKQYNPSLLQKKRVICFSRIDAVTEDGLKAIKKCKFEDDVPVYFISSVANKGIDELKYVLWNIIKEDKNK